MTDLERIRNLRDYVIGHWDSVPSWQSDIHGDDGAGCLIVQARRIDMPLSDLNDALAGKHEDGMYRTLCRLIFGGSPKKLLKGLDRAIARLEEREAESYQPAQEDPGPLTRQFYALHRAKRESAAPERQLCGVGTEV